ncbi:MAG: phosphate regulon sensor histidine kinase PhoR [Pseudomonadales bacterium]|nr:phosphate regulon sensor histidine kinase PhoR [Pseudomonadales bacterium]
MSNSVKQEVIQFLVVCFSLFGLSYLAGYPFIGLSIGLAVYLIRTLYHLSLIRNWLDKPTEEPPEARGVWGEIYDGIYHLRRREKEETFRLKATIDYLHDSFSSLPDGVVMLNKRGHIEWSNKSTEKLLGLQYPNDQNQVLVNLIRDPLFTTYLGKEEFGEHLQITSPVSDYLTLQIRITFFGKRDKLLFVRDVTNVIKLERMRQDFVANVSHELRTPLTVVRGYLETFQDFSIANDFSATHWQSALAQMLGQTMRMESLVKDLLTLSQLEIETESESHEAINLGKLTQNICEELFAVGTDNRTITNVCPETVILTGNPGEIRSVITNLLSNAIKYTDDDGEIWVSWVSEPTGGVLSVRDSGIGISDIHLPRLTERFYRADKSRSVKTGGTGLGLAIVKHILIRHHASLTIESELGVGSTFSCHFRSEDLQNATR